MVEAQPVQCMPSTLNVTLFTRGFRFLANRNESAPWSQLQGQAIFGVIVRKGTLLVSAATLAQNPKVKSKSEGQFGITMK